MKRGMRCVTGKYPGWRENRSKPYTDFDARCSILRWW
jgi:hypothetical protein